MLKVSNLADFMSQIRQMENNASTFEAYGNIYFLKNFTVDRIDPFLKYYLLNEKIRPNIVYGTYDNITQEILDDGSSLHTTNPDVVVLSLMLETFDMSYNREGWNYEETKKSLKSLYELIATKTKSLLAINTFIPPFYNEAGLIRSVQDRYHQMLLLNQFVRDYAVEHSSRFFLMDWEHMIRQIGEQESIDYRYWYTSKAPFKSSFQSLYALEITKIVRALKGKTKKCILLDCDNTLWGGVVGEDGIEGIKLDSNHYPGKAYYDFQKSVLNLIKRGVMVGLVSKNNEEDVWEVLSSHPDCLIKKSDLAVWRINWNQKDENIASIIKQLNIGEDSIVFVDDNPMECEIVRRLLPEVRVLQVPEKLYEYPNILYKEGLFDKITASQEDQDRTKMYQDETARKSEQSKYSNLEQFLSSLELQAIIHPAKTNEIQRIAQLTQKTNQFNVSTRRYSEEEIKNLTEYPNCVYSLRVQDKFGDYGLTGVFIAKLSQNIGYIDTYLLSCRVLGRNVELAFIHQCMNDIEQMFGIKTWEASYVPTKKNQQVSDFWDRIGFDLEKTIDDEKVYGLIKPKRKVENISYIKITEE
ncbi:MULTISPECIES: HAD-IIIC family phosphatase [unclassified Paenibacillus]|uniref:HAD-IIIC family phosphatase n=1 Tax=unclassified Paenibacillus TaxID=185978 RepID=UPI00363ADD1D